MNVTVELSLIRKSALMHLKKQLYAIHEHCNE